MDTLANRTRLCSAAMILAFAQLAPAAAASDYPSRPVKV